MIVGFSGKIGSGKTTVVEMVGAALLNFNCMSFGDAIKTETAQKFGFPLELAYSEEGKASEWAMPSTVMTAWGELVIPPRVAMTVRECLQWWGTDICRAHDPEYWIKRTAEDIKLFEHVLVDDVRMPNEAEFICSRGGRLFRIETYPGWKPGPNGDHITETALDDYDGWSMVYAPAFGELKAVADDVEGAIIFLVELEGFDLADLDEAAASAGIE